MGSSCLLCALCRWERRLMGLAHSPGVESSLLPREKLVAWVGRQEMRELLQGLLEAQQPGNPGKLSQAQTPGTLCLQQAWWGRPSNCIFKKLPRGF